MSPAGSEQPLIPTCESLQSGAEVLAKAPVLKSQPENETLA